MSNAEPFSDRDIWLSAAEMIKAHGEQVWEKVVVGYFDLKQAGDEWDMATWRRIARAICDFANKLRDETEN